VFIPHEDDHRRAWVRRVAEVLKRFPSGKYDDEVDAFSQAVIYLGGDRSRGGTYLGVPDKPASRRRAW